MVVGKLLMLLVINPANAEPIDDPKFFNYNGSAPSNRLVELTFGWFRTLDEEQLSAYYQSINHALLFSENGETVRWYVKDASGEAVPVMTWPTGSGYCRRLHIQAIAYNVEKTMAATACYNNASRNWRWV